MSFCVYESILNLMDKRKIILSAITFTFFLLTVWFEGTENLKPSDQRFLAPPPEGLEWFHFGFRESLADSLWIRWIQDGDTCQTYLKPIQILRTPGIHQPESDPSIVPRYRNCDQSWSYKMLEAVTQLDPRFEIPYLAGGSMLAILVEDYEGASKIYERGIAQFPNDWQLLYRASFHFQFNVKDRARAASLLNQAAENGAPEWVRSLASRLYSEAGQVEMALGLLLDYRKTLEGNEEALKKVDQRIQDLQKRVKSP